MTKTEAMERCRRAIEERCNQHGHIRPDDLGDALQYVVNDLEPEESEPEPEPTASE